MITVVDYGMGNLRSVEKGFERFGFEVKVSDNPNDIKHTDKLVLPGVGAFKDAMIGLQKRGLIEPIIDFVRRGKPFLGICSVFSCCFHEVVKMVSTWGWTLSRAR